MSPGALPSSTPYLAPAMNTTVQVEPRPLWSYSDLLKKPSEGFEYFVNQIIDTDPRVRGRVLDIGCNDSAMPVLEPVLRAARQWDGLDPAPSVNKHPMLVERWHAPIEEAGFPEGAYDAAFAWFVLEHITDPAGFMRSAVRALRPGGVFYAATPHLYHPFPWLSRSIELVGFKRAFHGRLGDTLVNDYPAYYRLNSVGAMRRACRGLPVSKISVWHMPTIRWSSYFPRFLRWGPKLYDRVIQGNFPSASQLIVYRVERAEEPPAGAER